MPVQVKVVHEASCHCGEIRLRLTLPNGIEDPRRCNCSMCKRRGAIVASVNLANLEVIHGQDFLSVYRFNTGTAKHFFCKKCGIYTHHQRRSNPNQYGYNIACLEGVNPFEINDVPVIDGINHPADKK